MVHGHAKDLTVPGAETDEIGQLARRMRLASSEQLETELRAHLGAVRE